MTKYVRQPYSKEMLLKSLAKVLEALETKFPRDGYFVESFTDEKLEVVTAVFTNH